MSGWTRGFPTGASAAGTRIRRAVSESLLNRNSPGRTVTTAAVGATSVTPDARTMRSLCEPPSTWRALVPLIVADAAICGVESGVAAPCGGVARCAAARAAAVTPDCGCVITALFLRIALESVRTCIDPAAVIAELRDGG